MKLNGIAVWVMALTLGLGTVAQARDVSVRDFDYNEEPTGGDMFLDALVVRPMTLGAAVVGAVTWVITLPFTLFSGNAGEAGANWVGGPLKYTFTRPLGDLDPGPGPNKEYSGYDSVYDKY
jgi:hypothetical protein